MADSQSERASAGSPVKILSMKDLNSSGVIFLKEDMVLGRLLNLKGYLGVELVWKRREGVLCIYYHRYI